MRRSTVIMLVILGLLAGLYWYAQQPDNALKRTLNPGPTPTYSILGYVVGPEQAPFSRITIERADGKSLMLDKNTGNWMILSAESAPADPNKAETASQDLLSLRIMATIDPAPDLPSVGLEAPAYTVKVITVSGAEASFKVGAKTVTGTGYYIQQQDNSVVVVSGYVVESLTALVDNPPYLNPPTP